MKGVEGRCERHSFERAEQVCRACGYEFCHECLVYTYGPKQAPFCVKCAISAAGVRSTAGHQPRATPRQIKKEIRARRRAPETEPLANGPVNFEVDWAVPDDDYPTTDPAEPELKPAKRRKAGRGKGKGKHKSAAVEGVEAAFGAFDEGQAAEPVRPALVDPLLPRETEPPAAAPLAEPAAAQAALPARAPDDLPAGLTAAPPPAAPPAPIAMPPRDAPIVIDPLVSSPFDPHVAPTAPTPAAAAWTEPAPASAAGPSPAPAPATFTDFSDLPSRPALPATDAGGTPIPVATDAGGTPIPPKPQPVAGPRILDFDSSTAPAPFPGPRVAEAPAAPPDAAGMLPTRSPGAQRPATPPPPAAPPAPPAPPAAAPPPVRAPMPVASAPAEPVPTIEGARSGFRRLMPSSVRSKGAGRKAAAVEKADVDLSSFPGLGPMGPKRVERELKTLAEMRPDELDNSLPDVTDLYDKVTDQNATTL